MADQLRPLAATWNEAGWVSFYENKRDTTSQVYPSEWFFLESLLVEGMSVLDVGCAVGGFASILAQHLRQFTYTGVDISAEMIERARKKHRSHQFHVVDEADLAVLADNTYDVVIALGVLHVTRKWRELVGLAWARTKQSLLIDLRESVAETIEDEKLSYFRVGHLLETGSTARLPYNIINTSDALAAVIERCRGAANLQHYGYLAPPSASAVTPVPNLVMNTYRIDKPR